MNKGRPDSTSTGSSSESGTPPTSRPVECRVIRPARAMNVSRPVSQTAVQKIASAAFWEKKV